MGSALQGRLGARPGRRGPGVQRGVGTWPPGRFPRPPEGPSEGEAPPALWPFVTGSHAGGRREKHPRLGRGARPRARAPRPERGAPASCVVRAGRRGLPARGVHAGGGLERGRRPPLPPAPPPPSLLLPPGAQRPPPPELRAAREMAPVWPPRPAQASVGSPGARRPRARDPPKRPPRPAPGPGRGAPAGSWGPGSAVEQLPALGAQRQPGRKEGRGEEPPLAARPQPRPVARL